MAWSPRIGNFQDEINFQFHASETHLRKEESVDVRESYFVPLTEMVHDEPKVMVLTEIDHNSNAVEQKVVHW